MKRWTVFVLAPVLLAALACMDPSERRPGLRLTGEVVKEAVTDWSFTHAEREIYIETRTPYGIPHSVTILCADAGGKLYVGARNPEGKRWVRWVQRDPNVRLKIAGRVYEAKLSPMSEPAQIAEVAAAYAAKRGPAQNAVAAAPPAAAAPTPTDILYWRVDPRDG